MKASSGLVQWRSGLRFELLGSSVSSNRLCVSPVRFIQRSPRLPTIRAAYNSEGGSKRRAYKESQAASGFPNVKVQQIASSILPVGSFVVVTFGTHWYKELFLNYCAFPLSCVISHLRAIEAV